MRVARNRGPGVTVEQVAFTVTCRVLKLARQPYYRWLGKPVADAALEEVYRANALFDAHRDDPEIGYRFLADEAHGTGARMADRTTWRIHPGNHWWSVFGKKRGPGGKAGPPVHDDLVSRDFTAPDPNRLRLADITEPATAECKLHLCAIKDVSRNRIPTAHCEPLEMGCKRRLPAPDTGSLLASGVPEVSPGAP